jgi:hypothetical protein
MLREIAKRALWHMPNSETEACQLARIMVIETSSNLTRATMLRPVTDPAEL